MRNTVSEYPNEYGEQCERALAEAWAHLEREGFVAPQPGQSAAAAFLTRKGQVTVGRAEYLTAQEANRFPSEIHRTIHDKCFSLFIRGDYETAVFQAFKSVEVSVRTAIGAPESDYGVSLMRTAFHPERGQLTDQSEPVAEREALQALFAGSIGRFKNPSSHRHVSFDSPTEAIELLQLASQLLRIVDSRAPAP
jgi:uncharacterized protein (TIGR02391 family)